MDISTIYKNTEYKKEFFFLEQSNDDFHIDTSGESTYEIVGALSNRGFVEIDCGSSKGDNVLFSLPNLKINPKNWSEVEIEFSGVHILYDNFNSDSIITGKMVMGLTENVGDTKNSVFIQTSTTEYNTCLLYCYKDGSKVSGKGFSRWHNQRTSFKIIIKDGKAKGCVYNNESASIDCSLNENAKMIPFIQFSNIGQGSKMKFDGIKIKLID